MPIHDWTRVEAGIFRDFHHAWIAEIKRALNRVLPSYHCLAIRATTVREWPRGTGPLPRGRGSDGESVLYAAKAKAVVIRHVSKHNVIALVEIVSPGIVDLFPATKRDPQGIHRAIWQDREDTFRFSKKRPLTAVSYLADEVPEAFIEPLSVGKPLKDMPLFLSAEQYVPVPLEATYQAAWEAVPEFWRGVVAGKK